MQTDIKKLKIVVFTASSDGVIAAAGGHVDVMAATPATVMPLVQAGKVRIIGIASNTRLKGAIAAVPTFKEQGIDAVFDVPRGFIGARGYLVTYRLTDPLYVLDLSQPSDPKIAGELQVSGYSDYLFPLTENLLLGVGKEAISDGTSGDGRFAWYQGVKLSLIDVADPTHPREAARSLVGKRGTDATVLHDHHGIALQTLGGVVRVSLPVSLHDSPPYLATGAASDYFKFTRTELQKFEINLSGQSLVERPPLGSKLAGERSISSDRSLLWNNQVHYYQDGVWRSGVW